MNRTITRVITKKNVLVKVQKWKVDLHTKELEITSSQKQMENGQPGLHLKLEE